MLQKETEKSLTWLLAIGTVFVTCLVWTGNVTDPVNAPKLLAIGSLAFGVLGALFRVGPHQIWLNSKFLFLTVSVFVFFIVTSTIFSNAPVVQSLYGVYGRNTGALTYFSLSILALGASLLSNRDSHLLVIRAMVVAGILNVIYCFWVLSFGDPIPWNNTYKNILGLLGNPDFISAFLGMIVAASLGFVLFPKSELKPRIAYSTLIFLSAFLIYKSHSIQGIFVALAGSSAVLFFFVRDKFKSYAIHLAYLVLVLLGAAFAIAGMLQHGPFSFIYKKSVSLRGSYWKAGLNMGNSHPLTGVGLDSYGDWYRSARPPIALIDTPGPTVLSNVSHNIVIDLFASGGYPLLLSYIAILILGIAAIVKLVKMHKKYDLVTVVLSAAWLGYQAQSIVSINQIGLAIWGWILTGLLIGYARISSLQIGLDKVETPKKSTPKRNANSQIISPQLVIGVGLVVGAIVSVPPMSSDARWFNASQSRDLVTFKSALVESYLNPLNSTRFVNAAATLQNSNFLPDAHEFALKGIEFNPDYFESYLVLYGLPNSTDAEKKMAMANMKRLDPKNPDVLHYK